MNNDTQPQIDQPNNQQFTQSVPNTEQSDMTTQSSSATGLTSPSKKKPNYTIICLSIVTTIAVIAAIVFAALFFTQPRQDNSTGSDQTSSDEPKGPTESQEKEPQKKSYQLSNYVTYSEVQVPVILPDEIEKGHTEDIVKKINLSNINQTDIAAFNEKQEGLINENQGGYIISRNNEAGATINEDILSVYSIFNYQGIYGSDAASVTLNYDLASSKEISNEVLISAYNVTAEQVYDKILNQLVENVATQSFLLNTDGDVRGPIITLSDFKNNIPEYKTTLASNLPSINLYIDSDNVIHALYKQNDILEQLGMGTHMGIGLLRPIQDVALTHPNQ